MRGGFGIVFNRNSDAVYENIRQDTPYSALATACCFFDPGPNVGPPAGSNIQYSLGANKLATSFPENTAFANGVAPDGALCANAGCTAINPVSLFGALRNEPNPYVYIYSYQIELQPLANLVVKMGYQGSRSRKLVRTIDLNRIMPGDTFDGVQDKFQNDGSNGQPCGPTNPTCSAPHATGNNRFSNLYFPLPDVNASYDAAVFSVTRRFNHGFQLDANYTWSHAIDTASYEIGYQQTDPGNQSSIKAVPTSMCATILSWTEYGSFRYSADATISRRYAWRMDSQRNHEQTFGIPVLSPDRQLQHQRRPQRRRLLP